MGFLWYNQVDKNGSASYSKYPSWNGAEPNLLTCLDALNLSQPIIGAQFELVHSRWPRTLFYAKNVTMPGLEVNVQEINHAGFSIPISCNTKYSTREVSFTILADKEGYHYYDWRNMVFQSGHPLVAGDTRSTIGSEEKLSDEDILEVRLRNTPEDGVHHHWTVHNFRPTKIGDLEMSHDSSSFVTFDVTGTFTHIHYDCGYEQEREPVKSPPSEDEQDGSSNAQNPSFDDEGPLDSSGNPMDSTGGGSGDGSGGDSPMDSTSGGSGGGSGGDSPMDSTSGGSEVPVSKSEPVQYMNSNRQTMHHPNGSIIYMKAVDTVSLPEGSDEDDRKAAEAAAAKKKAAQDKLEADMKALGDMPNKGAVIFRRTSGGMATLTSMEQAEAYDKAIDEYDNAVALADEEFEDHQKAKADQQKQQEQESDEKKQDFEEQF